jgi:C_GCAxxG_C_C family probable redox protein
LVSTRQRAENQVDPLGEIRKEHLMEKQNQPQKSELGPNWAYRGRTLSNLLRMGHCAPTVMQTILDVLSTEKEWLVRLSAGMPGGIGNTGFECGAVTSPLVLLGIRYGLGEVDRGLPVIFDKGQALCHNFLACHKTLQCREIRGKDRFPRHCIGPVTRSPELYLAALDGNHQEAIPAVRRAGYSRLYSHLVENDFHCAQAVLIHLGYTPTEDRELFDATSAFMGGTLFMGRTCSAFTAGVMAIGLRAGEIENSRLRVIRLLAIMTIGGNAFDEKINKFNRSMNRGYKLSRWITKEFGSTQCQPITGCDFSDPTGVSNFVESDCITRCREITEKVAERVQMLLA